MFSHCRLGLSAVSLLVLAAAVPVAIAASPADSQQTARVWFLRPSSGIAYEVQGATPAIYANGAPVGAIRANAAFYRDFAPGTYSFAVQPYGIPTGQVNTVQLSPGSQTFLQIAWVPAWQEGYALPDHGSEEACDFFVLNMAPQLARAYLPGLTAQE
jgi:hypothetical protein